MFRRAFLVLVAGVMVVASTESFAKDGSKAGRVLLNAVLGRSVTAPPAAKGKAKYDESKSRTNFRVEAENLVALNGATAIVKVNGTVVGSKAIALGRFHVELSTERGQQVPTLTAGALVEVSVNGSTILSGGLR